MTSPIDRQTPVPSAATRRYATVAIALHWIIAALLAVQLALGWTMNEVLADHTPPQRLAEAVHISLGLTILLLVVIRIVVRLAVRPPPLPAGMPTWERRLAHAVHLIFYALMLIIPLTGWALVSLGSRPVLFWGLPWPHLPAIHAVLGDTVSRANRQSLKHIHVYVLIWIFAVNWLLHVAGAVKHQVDGHPVLWRMTWLAPPGSGPR